MTRALFLCLALTGCATFPAVNAAFDPNAKTPTLLPTSELPTFAQNPTADPLSDRTDALRTRADALRAR